MKISILTLFPQMFTGPFDYSIIKRAIEDGLIELNIVDIRDFGIGRHKTVDDKPYGGGFGMILRADILKKAIDETRDKRFTKEEEKIILLGPKGKTFNQSKALELSSVKHLILVCGHYEGVDDRIRNFLDEEISIGDFIVTGGEIPSMLIADSVARLVPGVLKKGVTERESFSKNLLEHPQYTRPRSFDNLDVPETITSGNHQKIDSWKKSEAEEITKKLRKDLLKKVRS